MSKKLGFAPRKRHILEQVVDKDGKPVENSYICVTCEKERR